MSKTYQALIKAEKLRAAQDPEALARRLARTAEEGETLRAELRAAQEQLAALVEKVDSTAAVDPSTVEDLGRQVARLAAEQERLAAEPRRLLEDALRQLREELDQGRTGAQSQSDQVADLSQQLDKLRADVESLRDATGRAIDSAEQQRSEQRRLAEELPALAGSFESVRARLEDAETSRRGDAERLQAELQGLQGNAEALRANVDALREQWAAADDGLRQLRQHWEKQLAQRDQNLSSLSEETRRVARESAEGSQAALQGLADRLAAVEEAQSHSDRRLQDLRGSVEPLVTGELQPAGEVDALRDRVATLAEAQSQQRQLAEGVERAQADAKIAAQRISAVDEAWKADAETLRQRVAELQADLSERLDSLQASLAGPLQAVAVIESLRAEVSVLAQVQERQQQLSESVERAQASVDEVARQGAATERARAAGTARLQKEVAALQSEGATLREALDTAQSALAQRLDTGLTAAEARQDEIADAATRAQKAADEAGQRIAANDQAQSATVADLRRQLESLRAESAAAAASALARQEEAGDEIAALRAQVARMMEAQQRQRELLEELLLIPASTDAPADADADEPSELATLRRQVVALQADRLRLDTFLETRFELLCGILDTELQGKLEEIRGDGGAPDAPGRRSRKILPRALSRWAASIAGRFKKPD